ncbi:MAG: SRPBCC family protein [Armatimonadota bacterium]|nr:SRPBCC family protein [Armatimonadota bacterium]
MPTIESKIHINAPLETVWELAQDVEKLPDIMPDLDAVRVLERQQPTPVTTRTVTDWEGRIKQFNRKMAWTEEDIWNDEDHTCRFWQIKGDFDEYRGEYSFRAENGGTTVHVVVHYRFDVPLIGALMAKVVQKLMQENSDSLLRSLKAEAERRAGQAERRTGIEDRLRGLQDQEK